jgi:hypothetical protein
LRVFPLINDFVYPSERLLDLFEAILADALSVKENDVVSISAENAGRLIFLKDYLVVVGEYLKRVLFSNVHGLSDADREHDSSKLVYLANYSG